MNELASKRDFIWVYGQLGALWIWSSAPTTGWYTWIGIGYGTLLFLGGIAVSCVYPKDKQ